MGSKSVSVPPPPEMSAEERQLLQNQNLTLQQFNDLLSDSKVQSRESMDILKNLSGLYKTETVTGERAPTTEELRELERAGTWKPGDPIPWMNTPITQTTLDRDALQQLRDRIQANVEYQDQISGLANQSILDELSRGASDYIKGQNEIGLLQTQRQLATLRGELPLSLASQKQKSREFEALRENLARTGNEIEGETPESAVGLSTAANEALGEFNSRWGLIEEQERRGELTSGEAANLSRYGLSSDISSRAIATAQSLASQYSPTNTPLGLLGLSQQYNPSSLLSSYGGLASLYGSATQPYSAYTSSLYNSMLQNAALASQGRSATSGLLGYAGSAGLMSGNPYGIGIGAGLLGYGLLTS